MFSEQASGGSKRRRRRAAAVAADSLLDALGHHELLLPVWRVHGARWCVDRGREGGGERGGSAGEATRAGGQASGMFRVYR